MTNTIRKRRRAYFDDTELFGVLKIINRNCREHIKMRLIVGNCEELDSPSIWYVHFDADDYEWGLISTELNELKTVVIADY